MPTLSTRAQRWRRLGSTAGRGALTALPRAVVAAVASGVFALAFVDPANTARWTMPLGVGASVVLNGARQRATAERTSQGSGGPTTRNLR